MKQARNLLNKSLNEDLFFETKYLQITKTGQSSFKPGHRKTNSLEAGSYNQLQGNSLKRNNFNLIDDSPNCDIFKMNYLDEKCGKKPTLEVLKLRKPFSTNYNIDSSSYSNEEDSSSVDDLNKSNYSMSTRKLTYSYNDLLHSGFVSRKNILKVGKKPSVILKCLITKSFKLFC